MAGLVPAIHVGPRLEPLKETLTRRPDVDPRDKPGDDGLFRIDGLQ
jgi:hypothetical protein